MAQLITNASGQVKTVESADATKAYGGYDGAFGLLFGMAGVSGRNLDLTPTRTGAAAAYQVIPAVNRSVNLRADAVQSLKWLLVSNRKAAQTQTVGKPGEDDILDDSEAQEAKTPFGEAMREAQRAARVPLIWQMVFDHDLYGENFVEPLGNRYRTNGMKRLNPLGMRVNVEHGELAGYTWTPGGNSSETVEFEADALAYAHTLNPFDDFRGQGLLEVAMDALNISRNLKRFLLSFFRNNARPGAVVSPVGDGNWSESNRNIIKTEFQTYVKGSDNAYTTLVSPTPLKLDTFEQPDIEALYSVNDPMNTEIYTIFGVPLAMAGDNGRTRYKQGSDVLSAFYLNTIIPLARQIQDYINFQVLPFFDLDDVTFRFDLSEFDQASSDDKLRSDIATSKFMATLITRNEARVYAGDLPLLDPSGNPSPEGEAFYVPPAPPVVPGTEAPQLESGKPPPADKPKELPAPAAAQGKPAIPNAEPKPEADARKSVIDGSVEQSGFVCLWLANDAQVLAAQNQLRQEMPDAAIEWQDPATFHVTLVYAPNVNDDALAGIAHKIGGAPVPIEAHSIGLFENNGDGRALYLRVEPNETLQQLQMKLFDAFGSRGLALSPFSTPQDYTPHITMAYLPPDVLAPSMTPHVHTAASEVHFGRSDYQPFTRVSLTQKSAPQKSANTIRFILETQKAAEDELRAWRRIATQGNALKSFTIFKLDKHIEQFVRDGLEDIGAGASKALVRAVFEDAAYAMGDWGAAKTYEDIASSFQSEAGALLTDADDDSISSTAFGSRYRSALRRAGLQMFRQGMEDQGVSPESLSADQLKVFRDWQAETSLHVGNLRKQAYSADGLSNPDARPDMWTNVSLRGIYYKGAASVAPDAQKVWRLGATEKHCASCAGRNGQIKSLAVWDAEGFPGSFDQLDCHGVWCDCHLDDVSVDDSGSEKSHSRSKCMMCDAPPTKDVKWAEGMARAWFCDKHFAAWSKEHLDDTDYVHDITDGEVPTEFNKSVKEYDPAQPRDDHGMWTMVEGWLHKNNPNHPDHPGNRARAGNAPEHVQTLDGKFEHDVGAPGDTEASLNDFLQGSNGPLSYAMADPAIGMLSVDYDTDKFSVNRGVVKQEAAAFVKESQNIQYSKDYLLSLAKERAADNGVVLSDAELEQAYNQQYATRAQAIQHLSRIGDVKLTDAQDRRLQMAADGQYLDMVYARDNSERGTLQPSSYGRGRHDTAHHGLKGAALEEARQNFRDWVTIGA